MVSESESEIDKLARMVQAGFADVKTEMKARFDAIDERFKGVDKRMDLLNQKIDRVDTKLDVHRQETKDGFAGIHLVIGGISETLVNHDERITALEP